MNPKPLFGALVFSLACFASPALELHSLFTPNAVFQQSVRVPVWGMADPGSEVMIRFGGQEVSAKADAEGDWIAILEPLVASNQPRTMMVESGEEKLEVGGILVGEVWVGSGQSNMAWTVERSLDSEAVAQAVEEGAYADIRLFKVPVDGTDTRMGEVSAAWSLPENEVIQRFSATAFYFAAKLSADRSVPVGMIQSANGGTNAFSWINSATYGESDVAAPIREYWATTLRNHPEAMERYKAALEQWKEKVRTARNSGTPVDGRAPREPLGPEHVKRPSGHYNAMIAPLQPYAIRGVIWYQGEANSRLPFYPFYKDLMLELVEDWRSDWAVASGGLLERIDFPFYLVQLPNFAGGDAQGWPRIREEMLRFWQEGEGTGMVVAIDKGNANDIHPADKKPVGERLALFARGTTYGENVVYSGPVFEALRIEGSTAILTFDHVGSGLASLDREPLAGFSVADGEGNFVEATAKISGKEVHVSAESVPEPRAVRYAWESNPEGLNFVNEEGLPASPFRTDSW